ncbi:TPA: DUF4145 domain-containing protein [Candidatus Berkelbacteria bacterium]|uniref:DUF4145 domain-containing protein n=1 Tax=Berkelbacteria bacterium GW2011_GWE1_39_12 TaxID=1618337 RepID=A0A0G4B3U3_9BACT|nr:MAG: hypothetical protein UT28_C0001G0854 [Berkelbacteria bacterium GW2011_GWE1_39_12]HBO60282.1 DUF4145 domain-containing protein [Candidatus Berkelbacteria bacterium]
MFKYQWNAWLQLSSMSPREFICGFCGKDVGSDHGYFSQTHGGISIVICTNCGRPTFFENNSQTPGPLLGRSVKHLPSDIKTIYQEMRSSIKEKNYTATLLLGRKLIMHTAVDLAGAKEGETFAAYVDFLKCKNYIPPNGEKWLKYIKDLGNEKNHEIKLGTLEEATKILSFIEMMLIFTYEFPNEHEEGINK